MKVSTSWTATTSPDTEIAGPPLDAGRGPRRSISHASGALH